MSNPAVFRRMSKLPWFITWKSCCCILFTSYKKKVLGLTAQSPTAHVQTVSEFILTYMRGNTYVLYHKPWLGRPLVRKVVYRLDLLAFASNNKLMKRAQLPLSWREFTEIFLLLQLQIRLDCVSNYKNFRVLGCPLRDFSVSLGVRSIGSLKKDIWSDIHLYLTHFNLFFRFSFP